MAQKAKFKMGQEVRCVNEDRFNTIVGISQCDGFYYNIQHYNGDIVHRIPESDLVARGKK